MPNVGHADCSTNRKGAREAVGGTCSKGMGQARADSPLLLSVSFVGFTRQALCLLRAMDVPSSSPPKPPCPLPTLNQSLLFQEALIDGLSP